MSEPLKRKFNDSMEPPGDDASVSPYMPMFEQFRTELDEHHDRRERVIKASRDITAASKKIIFALQRVRNIKDKLPPHVEKSIQPHRDSIHKLLNSIAPDLQSINAHRYARQISPGIQEYLESRIFLTYLESQTLLSYRTATAELDSLVGSDFATQDNTDKGVSDQTILLTPEDYLLGVFDATGELMRFAITTMATSGANVPPAPGERTVLNDLQALRIALCQLAARAEFEGYMAREVRGKMAVMLASVDKVERALYGLVVRGSERPKGWVPDLREGERAPVDADGDV